jgi:hypothetical protein
MLKKSDINNLNMTPEEARAFIRKVMGPPKRQLEGDEYQHMMMVLSLKEPVSSSNNQRFWTDDYEHNGRKYEITYGVENNPLLYEIGD